jgi:hypothetical protein
VWQYRKMPRWTPNRRRFSDAEAAAWTARQKTSADAAPVYLNGASTVEAPVTTAGDR